MPENIGHDVGPDEKDRELARGVSGAQTAAEDHEYVTQDPANKAD